MTPRELVGLAALLVEVRDYIRETDPGNLDAEVIDAAVDALVRLRDAQLREGAR